MAALCLWQYGHRGQAGLLNIVSPVSYVSLTVMMLSVAVFLSATSIFSRITPGRVTGRLLVTLSGASFGVFLVHLLVFEVIRLNVPGGLRRQVDCSGVRQLLGTLAFSFAVAVLAARIPFVRNIF